MTAFIPLFDEPTPSADLQNWLNILINEINAWLRTMEASSTLFPSRFIASMLEIPATVLAFETAGYATRGDGGGALYIPASGTTPGGFQSYNGLWWQLATQPLNVRMFGATGNGVTDDTTALQLAATACSVSPHQTLYIPRGTYLVSATPFSFTGPYLPNIVGEGMGGGLVTGASGLEASTIVLATGTAATVDVISVSITTDAYAGVIWRDFGIVSQGGWADNPGRYGIVLDQKTNEKIIYRLVIERVFIRGIGNSTTGCSFASLANTGTNGGLADSVVRDCYFESSFWQYIGDNILLDHCRITCFRTMGFPAIHYYNVGGAADFRIVNCSLGSYNGEILCEGAVSTLITGNEFESQTTHAGSNGAMVDLAGVHSNIDNAVIVGNGFSSNVGTDNPIRIGSATSTYIEGNRFQCVGAFRAINITGSSADAYIGFNKYKENGVVVYQSWTNAGLRTILNKVWEDFTPTVTSSAGTITTVGAVTGTWAIMDGITQCAVDCTITTNGTGSGFVKITTPTTPTDGRAYLNGVETGVTNDNIRGGASSSGWWVVQFYDGSYPGADGARLIANGWYR